MSEWKNNETYSIEYTIPALGEYRHIGVIVDQDATWIYADCVGVGKKAFRKNQVLGVAQ